MSFEGAISEFDALGGSRALLAAHKNKRSGIHFEIGVNSTETSSD